MRNSEKTNVKVSPSVISIQSTNAPRVIDLSKMPQPEKISVPKTAIGTNRELLPPSKKRVTFKQFITVYSVEDGLQTPSINASAVDHFGNLWIAAGGGGAARFNGTSFAVYDVDQGLAGRQVLSIFVDSSGNIWFGTQNGASRYDGRSFKNFGVKEGLVGNTVNAIIEDKNGSFWFATSSGISRFDGQTFSNFTKKEGLIDDFVRTILIDDNGRLWFGTLAGISRFDGTSFTNFTTEQGLVDNAVFASSKDQLGNLWFGTENGISKYNGQAFANWTKTDKPALSARITSILADQHGHLWFGTQGEGVLEFDGKSFSVLSQTEGLSNNDVTSLVADKTGEIWIGTNDGINRYDRNSFENLGSTQGIEKALIRTVLEDNLGNIWLGTEGGGIVKYDGKSLTTYTDKQGLGGNAIRGCLKDKEGNLWFGHENGVSRYDGRSFTNYSEAQGFPQRGITTIQEDKSGNLWFASYIDPGFLGRFDGKLITVFTKQQGLPGNRIVKILQDHEGYLWFATDGGASKYDGKSFTNYTATDGLPSNEIINVFEDEKGNMWFSTQIGLSRFDGRSFQTYYVEQGLSRGGIANLLLTRQGEMAIMNLHGLFLFPGYALRRLENDKKQSKMCEGAGKIDIPVQTAMLNEELQNYAPVFENFTPERGYPTGLPPMGQNSMIIDRDGRLWIGTVWEKTGVVRVNPAELLERDHRKPSPFLVSVKVNSKSVNWNSLKHAPQEATLAEEYTTFGKMRRSEDREREAQEFKDLKFDEVSKWYPVPRNLILPYRHNNLTFEVGTVELSRPQDVLYQYKLEGYDKDWRPPTRQISASYGNIDEGTYQFKVIAKSPSGVCSEPLVYEFRVLPPWYRTWWAYTLYVVIAVILLFSLYRWRTATLRARQKFLEMMYRAAERFVPRSFLNLIHRKHLEDVALGDSVERSITVLFNDIRNFTTIVEARPPGQAFAFANRYWAHMAPIIRNFGGYIDQYQGDAILAIFPESPEDAIMCAVAMVKELETFNVEQQKLNDAWIGIGIGLSTGSAMLGVLGEQERYVAGLIGDVANTAARIEGLNKIYGSHILFSGETLGGLSASRSLTRKVDKVRLKGKTVTTEIHEVIEWHDQLQNIELEEYLKLFYLAQQKYFTGDFAAAKTIFEECLTFFADDRVVLLLLNRCNEFQKDGALPGWDGTFKMLEK